MVHARAPARWAHVPWVGLFDPAITDGAQHGFYIVYLFSADMKRVYLSMNQGTTEVKDELGAGEETFNELRSRAAIMRERAPDFQKRLKLRKIDLASERSDFVTGERAASRGYVNIRIVEST
ncbi:MAG: DUF3578 domain-containing protein, partial [Methyloceanibacter sp.]